MSAHRSAGPATTPWHADVFSQLPARLARALATPEVGEVVDRLVADGWRPGQLRSRVGSEPAQGSVEQDAAHLLAVLRGLVGEESPDARHARERVERALQRRLERERAPRPAAPEVRDHYLAQIRSGLSGAPRRRPQPQPRLRPDCTLCGRESQFFVRRDVHLCGRCVDVLAAGEVRLPGEARTA